MSIQNLLKNIFHRTPDPAKIKRKEHEKAKRTYTRENYIKYLCEEENKEFLNEFVYNKKLNILSCKNANKWLKCSNYTSTEKNAYRSLEDKKMLNKRLLYHYYINNWVNCKYVHQTYFPESIPISLNSEIKETLEFIIVVK